MLTTNDYRAALLQAYRAFRISPSKPSKPVAYNYARAIIKPLPDSRETQQLRNALRDYQNWRARLPADFPSARIWHACYRAARQHHSL